MSALETQYDLAAHHNVPRRGPGVTAESQPVGQLTRWLAMAGVVGPLMYVVDFTIVGSGRPGYSAVSQAVSELGIGPDGWQLNVALIALGVLLALFSVGFFRSLTVWSGQARRWVCAGLLMLPAVGFAMAGIYPLPNPLHWLLGATLVFLGSIPAFFVSGLSLRRELAWRGVGTYAVVTGWLTLLLVILMFGVANPSSPAASIQIVGLVERALFVEMLAWYAAVGWQIFRKGPQRTVGTPPGRIKGHQYVKPFHVSGRLTAACRAAAALSCSMPRTVRVAVIGLGTVGTWVLRALAAQGERLSRQYGFMPNVVAVSNAHDGLVYRADGIDPAAVLSALSERRSLAELPGVRRWSTALEGLQSLEADMLVEVTSSPRETGEPGSAHMRTALQRGMCVASSNKWPVALHGVELVELARTAGLVFRAESTVMSGTPVLSTLTDGLAGARPIGLRGILNATSNFILSRMTSGQGYEAALAQAQAAGLAERDPSADVDGHDAVAKLMILSGLVFGTQLQFQSVERLGIADLDAAAVRSHVASGGRVRHVATLEPQASSGGSSMRASVRPVFLEAGDPLAAIDGVTNALICRVEPVGEVTIIGPGAGLALAGQGVLSDVIAIGRRFR